MKLKTIILTIAALLAATAQAGDYETITVNSQKYNKWSSSQNFINGVKAFEDYYYNVAIEAFKKELKLHPANVYAALNKMQAEYALLDFECELSEEDDTPDIVDKRLSEAKASKVAILDKIDNTISKLNTADAEGLCAAWQVKALMTECVDIEECDTALVNACYDKAIAIHPCADVYKRHIKFNVNNRDILKVDGMKWYELEPNNLEALANMILMSYENEEYDQTLQYIQKYQELIGDEKNQGLLLIKAESLNKLGRSEEAITIATDILEENMSNEILVYFMRFAYSNPQFALSKVTPKLEIESELQPLWRIVAGFIEGDINHNYNSALEHFQKVHLGFKNNPLMPFKMALCYYMLGDDSKALINLDAACALPDNEMCYKYRDAMKLALGMTDELIKEKLEIIAIDSESGVYRPNEYNVLCSALLQNGNYQQVVDLMSTLDANIDNEDSVFDSVVDHDVAVDAKAIDLVTWGYALKKLGRDDDARKVFQRQVDEGDDQVSPCLPEMALIELGRTSEAKAALEAKVADWEKNNPHEISSLNISSTNTYYEIAATYALLGEYDTAVDYMQKHITYDPLPRNIKFMERDWRFDAMLNQPQYNTVLDMYSK